MTQVIDGLLERFGAEQGFGPLRLDDAGYCATELENGLLITFYRLPTGDRMLVMADIGPCPENDEDGADILEELLFKNFGCRPELSGVFALDSGSKRVQLVYHWRESETDAEAFTWFMQNVAENGVAARDAYAGLLNGIDDDDALDGE